MNKLLRPSSIAVVGVSSDPNKVGSVIYKNLTGGGYKGDVFIVNQKHEKLYGKTVYSDVSSIGIKVELVCIAVPSPFVMGVVTDCVKARVGAIVIISAGFGETGPEGAALQKQITKLCGDNDIRLLGPNCLGLINMEHNMNLSFAQGTPKLGNIAFMSQSGAFGTALLDRALADNLGFAHFVSLGNKADVGELDLLKEWLRDDGVGIIAAYIEQFNDGKQILDLYKDHIKRVKNPKPFIVIKPGKSEQSKAAIQSHTGAMAGDYKSVSVAMRQAGIVEVDCDKELYNTLKLFSWSRNLPGKRVAIITNAGGLGIMATDEIVSHGLEIAKLDKDTVHRLEKVLPAGSSVGNSIDILGDADWQRYNDAIEIVAGDSTVDTIVVLLTPQFVTQVMDSARAVLLQRSGCDKAIMPIFFVKRSGADVPQFFDENRMIAFDNINDCVQLIENSVLLGERARLIRRGGLPKISKSSAKVNLSDIESRLGSIGVSSPKQKVCSTVEEALQFAREIYPVVIKAPNDVVMHKTDIKAVYVGLDSDANLREAMYELRSNVAKKIGVQKCPVLIQEQIDYDHEIFIGAVKDELGGALLFGQGGIYTELYQDLGRVSMPASRDDVVSAFERTKIWKILSGVRGKESYDINKIVDAIMEVQKIVLEFDEIEGLDLNPLLVSRDGLFAVDVKLITNDK